MLSLRLALLVVLAALGAPTVVQVALYRPDLMIEIPAEAVLPETGRTETKR